MKELFLILTVAVMPFLGLWRFVHNLKMLVSITSEVKEVDSH